MKEEGELEKELRLLTETIEKARQNDSEALVTVQSVKKKAVAAMPRAEPTRPRRLQLLLSMVIFILIGLPSLAFNVIIILNSFLDNAIADAVWRPWMNAFPPLPLLIVLSSAVTILTLEILLWQWRKLRRPMTSGKKLPTAPWTFHIAKPIPKPEQKPFAIVWPKRRKVPEVFDKEAVEEPNNFKRESIDRS